MGPAATCDFFRKIIAYTSAKKDRDHLEIIIHNNARVPDRTEAVLSRGPSPVPELIRSGKLLIDAGAQLIVIPCITAHHFISDLPDVITSRIINAVTETCLFIREIYAPAKRVGILSTTGTIKARIFHCALEDYGLLPVVPSAQDQGDVMEAIYGGDGIKAGNTGSQPRNMLLKASNHLVDRGAEVIISGCTEIALVLEDKDIGVPLTDPMDIVAQRAIRLCLASKK